MEPVRESATVAGLARRVQGDGAVREPRRLGLLDAFAYFVGQTGRRPGVGLGRHLRRDVDVRGAALDVVCGALDGVTADPLGSHDAAVWCSPSWIAQRAGLRSLE